MKLEQGRATTAMRARRRINESKTRLQNDENEPEQVQSRNNVSKQNEIVTKEQEQEQTNPELTNR